MLSFFRIKPNWDKWAQATRKELESRILSALEPATLESLYVEKGQVIVTLAIDANQAKDFENKRSQIEHAIATCTNVEKAMVILTASRKETETPKDNTRKFASTRKVGAIELPHVKFVVAVASGKGGVGKSTCAVNLAASFKNLGWSVGLLDADIYGPSVPRLTGLSGQRPAENNNEQGKILPLEAHGLKVMSLGFMVDEEAPMIWRGPMVQSALIQLLRDVEWGTKEKPLDVLVLDLPPGTGDAHLTLAQKITLSGAVIISTPQDIALLDARKGLEMFRSTSVPVLGLIENMSYYCCPNCGHQDDIFGHGGAQKEADKLQVPFLGKIPLNGLIRQTSDLGKPLVSCDLENQISQSYIAIAKQIRHDLIHQTYAKAPPKIVIETE
jgi:ATP-binding protein involved in chromosome partitioning